MFVTQNKGYRMTTEHNKPKEASDRCFVSPAASTIHTLATQTCQMEILGRVPTLVYQSIIIIFLKPTLAFPSTRPCPTNGQLREVLKVLSRQAYNQPAVGQPVNPVNLPYPSSGHRGEQSIT